jgi:chromosome segregation ATPase
MKAIEEEYMKLKPLLEQVELMRDNVADIVGVEPKDLGGDWSEITSKLESLTSESEALSDVRTDNEKLTRRLEAALADIRDRQSSPQQANADYEKMLAQDLMRARNELEAKTKSVASFAERQHILRGLVEQFSTTVKDLCDLHSVICHKDKTSMRPAILAVICVRRFRRRFHADFDPLALLVFAGKAAHSPPEQLNEIRHEFAQLTQDLMVAKQTGLDLRKQLSTVLEERDIAHITLRSNGKEVKITRKKMDVIQARMKELQTELTSLVSPESFDQACQRLDLALAEITHLESKLSVLEMDAEKHAVDEKDMSQTIDFLRATADRNAAVAGEARDELAHKEEEIDELKALLREKTREVLHRERTIQRQEDIESTNTSVISCLSVENQGLRPQNRAGSGVDTGRWKSDTGFSPSASINPAFLGL